MQIQISYYAQLREQRGLAHENVQIESPNLRELYRGLARAHRFTLAEETVRPAVNDAFCPWERPLADGDHVVFIPPVSGG
jgi:molybdopterin synthase sulfur carrier subunit